MKRLLVALFFLLLGTCAQSSIVLQDAEPVDGGAGADDGMPRIDRDAACETVRIGATLTRGPVDVVMVIDNSLSMTAVIDAVQRNINQNFAQIIEQSGLDYRVIVVSHYGSHSADQSVCIASPLSGAPSCTPPPARPALTSRFFHYSVEVGSQNPFRVVLDTYNAADALYDAPNGWQASLRKSAFKTFIFFSDDETADPAAFLDAGLVAAYPSHFGTAAARNYRAHVIVGLRENTPAIAPYRPSDPLVAARCSGAQEAGIELQKLAQLTGGLRFPVCQTSSYDAVFREVAQGVVTGARVSCNFDVPPPPRGKVFRLDAAELEYTPGSGGAPRLLRQVRTAAECGPDAFYLQASRVQLCPSSCDEVSRDGGARIIFLLDCDVLVG